MVMAIDGQPAQACEARGGRVVLAPGNRVDLFVYCTLAAAATASIVAETGTDPVPIAHLTYGMEPARASPLPDPKSLPGNPLPERIELRGAVRPDFVIADGAATAVATKPLFSAKRGRTVVLNIAN